MLIDLLFLVLSLLCWTGACYRARDVRRTGNRLAEIALVTALAGLGLGLFMQIRPVESFVDQATGVPTAAKLLGHCFVLITAYASQTILVMTLTATRERAIRRAQRRAVVLLVVLGALVSLTLSAPAGQAPLRASDGVPLPNVSGTIYVGAYSVYLAIATVDICRMGFRYARLADRLFVRLGMLLIALGTAVGTGYAAGKVLLVAGRLAGVESTPVERNIIGPMVLIAATLTSVGAVLPALSRWRSLHPPVLWLVRLWSYRALKPLWAQLVASADVPLLLPTMWLKVSGSGFSLQFLLQRRVTEISDGLLQIRSQLDPRVAAAAGAAADAAGVAAAERRAIIEAATIVAALRTSNHEHGTDGAAPEPPPFSDLDRKAWWLQQVAWAVKHSPIARTAADHAVRAFPSSDGAAA